MKIKEVTVSRSGVVPTASYENLRPGYSITVELVPGDNHKQIITELDEYLTHVFQHTANAAKAELLASQYSGIRFYYKNGVAYPSVTSILYLCGGGAEKLRKANLTDDKLSQYAARGTIVGEMVETFLSEGKWIDPKTTEKLAEEVTILLGGSLKMHWDQCTHKAFCEKFAKEIQVESVQGVVFNDDALYAGTYDIFGTYFGKTSLMDVKCGAYDWRQLAAYAKALGGNIEQLVILPMGTTDNKCGYKTVKPCDTIEKEYTEFLKARAKFKQRFGL